MSRDPFNFNLPEPTKEERRRRHFLDFNGLWLFSNYKDSFLNEKCLCEYVRKRHLASTNGYIGGGSIRLNKQCLCEGFTKRGTMMVVSSTPKGNIPSKPVQQQEDTRLNRYVEQLAQV
jgi:hypothetical protein